MIETERLLLRPLAAGDVDDLLALQAWPEVVRFMLPVDRDRVQRWIEQASRDWETRGHGMMAVVDAASRRLVGRTGLRYWPQFDEVEVGWVLEPSVWGRGFATEAGRALVDWGFAELDVPYLTAMIRPDNERSQRVAGRLGMEPLRPDVLMGTDVVVHAVSRSAWADAQR